MGTAWEAPRQASATQEYELLHADAMLYAGEEGRTLTTLRKA